MTEVHAPFGADQEATGVLERDGGGAQRASDPVGGSPSWGRDTVRAPATPWALWQRVLFRFFCLYFLLQIAPWTWIRFIPGLGGLTRFHFRLEGWAVEAANARIFRAWDVLVPINGSGDTSYAWTRLWFYLSLAAGGAVVWSVLDRRRTEYRRLGWGLRTVVRYWVAMAALSYGIIKLFALQMPFPSLSQLATPLGDLLPMRLSWLFLGYSTRYQVFSGVMETVAGLLLLNRRTVTLGLLMAAGAFLNVVMINLSYDVPVKLYSMHLLAGCLFLLALDARRLLTLFVLNRPVSGTSAYQPPFGGVWPRRAMLALKALVIWSILVVPLRSGWNRHQAVVAGPPPGPFESGVYQVTRYERGGEPVEVPSDDPLVWRDVIFDNGGSASVGTADTVFWQRYGRGYFRYKADAASQTLAVWRTSAVPDSTYLFDMRYAVAGPGTVHLWTVLGGDSIHVELTRTDRHFQLAERQFHWLSEYNR